jgi:hypothetical protein
VQWAPSVTYESKNDPKSTLWVIRSTRDIFPTIKAPLAQAPKKNSSYLAASQIFCWFHRLTPCLVFRVICWEFVCGWWWVTLDLLLCCRKTLRWWFWSRGGASLRFVIWWRKLCYQTFCRILIRLCSILAWRPEKSLKSGEGGFLGGWWGRWAKVVRRRFLHFSR